MMNAEFFISFFKVYCWMMNTDHAITQFPKNEKTVKRKWKPLIMKLTKLIRKYREIPWKILSWRIEFVRDGHFWSVVVRVITCIHYTEIWQVQNWSLLLSMALNNKTEQFLLLLNSLRSLSHYSQFIHSRIHI